MADPFTPTFADLARNFTTTTGTGNIVLGNAVSGHVSLAGAVAVGERFYYCILGVDKPAQREVGRGTMMANGTIAREPISGALFNFTSGSKTISLVAAAEWFRTMGQMVNGGSDSLAALATTNKTSLVAAVNEVAAAAAGGGGGGGGAAPSVLFVAAGGSAIPAIVKSIETSGYAAAAEGAARYCFDAAVNAAFVAASPRTAFLAADGRGFKLDPVQHLTIEMFGGGTAMTAAENYAAIMSAIDFKPVAGRNFSPTVHFGIGTYLVSQTLEIHTVCHLKGVASGHNGSSVLGFNSTSLQWPINTKCIRIHESTTLLDGVRSPSSSAFSGKGSVFEGLWIKQAAQGTDLTAHAVQMRSAATLKECTFSAIAGDAVRIVASSGYGGALEGNANNWRLLYCFVHSCGGDALHIDGQDANAGINLHFITAVTVGGCGIFDSASLGNTHVMPQITGYGNGGVWHLGSIYQLIAPYNNDGGTTEPGTNVLVWHAIRTQAAPSASFPQWVLNDTYRLECPLHMTVSSTVVGGYQEVSNVLAHCPGAALINARFECTTQTNALVGLDGGAGLASVTGIGAYRGSGSDVNTPSYANEGAYSLTMLGTKNIYGTEIDRPNILEHQTAQDGSTSMAWYWSGKDQFLGYRNQKVMWSLGGPLTARTYGHSTPRPYYFTLHDFALTDPGNANTTGIFGIRATTPSAEAIVGQYFFNTNPVSGLVGRSCKVTGTPGTFGLDYLNERASPTVGIGYVLGAGGVITQATSKSTAVTLNKVCGAITMNAASLAASTAVSFMLFNSTIGQQDVITVCTKGGGSAGGYAVAVDQVTNGDCRISVRNMTAAALAEALVLNFAVIKAAPA